MDINFYICLFSTSNTQINIHAIQSTCIAIIMFTSFFQGGAISFLVERLDIEKADDREIDRRHRTIALESGGIGVRPSMAISGEHHKYNFTQYFTLY